MISKSNFGNISFFSILVGLVLLVGGVMFLFGILSFFGVIQPLSTMASQPPPQTPVATALMPFNNSTPALVVAAAPETWTEYKDQVTAAPQRIICIEGHASFFIPDGTNHVFAATTDPDPIYVDMPLVAPGTALVYCQGYTGSVYIYSD